MNKETTLTVPKIPTTARSTMACTSTADIADRDGTNGEGIPPVFVRSDLVHTFHYTVKTFLR